MGNSPETALQPLHPKCDAWICDSALHSDRSQSLFCRSLLPAMVQPSTVPTLRSSRRWAGQRLVWWGADRAEERRGQGGTVLVRSTHLQYEIGGRMSIRCAAMEAPTHRHTTAGLHDKML